MATLSSWYQRNSGEQRIAVSGPLRRVCHLRANYGALCEAIPTSLEGGRQGRTRATTLLCHDLGRLASHKVRGWGKLINSSP
jgi:hypothetical protein